ncbi:MAG TPA: hypothetical protein VFN65_07530 [Solirubrobacteraceae bacterium]|nr:hypothetical protein [Solirubrobacteraceae bacterium]
MTSDPSDERQQARRRAITEAEIRDIVRALRPSEVLGRDAIAEKCRAHTWQEGDFDMALQAAVRSGVVEALPDGFYTLAR